MTLDLDLGLTPNQFSQALLHLKDLPVKLQVTLILAGLPVDLVLGLSRGSGCLRGAVPANLTPTKLGHSHLNARDMEGTA